MTTTPNNTSETIRPRSFEVPKHPEWPPLSESEKQGLKDRIKRLLKEQNAVLVAHYYTDGDLQDLAEETGGCVADSLEMARFGSEQDAPTLVVAGVRFMGETAKILNPTKQVLMPDLAVGIDDMDIVRAVDGYRVLFSCKDKRVYLLVYP